VYPRLCGRLALAGACVVVVGVAALEAQQPAARRPPMRSTSPSSSSC
jgi:hypothetical protein